MLREKVTHEPAREVELRLSPASAPARMMNILEAERGAEAAAKAPRIDDPARVPEAFARLVSQPQ